MKTNSCKGFTLIELTVVVAIIVILVAIALPVYQGFARKSADNACLIEAKSYVNDVLVRLSDSQVPYAPSVTGACSFYSGANAALTITGSFTATSRAPGTSIVTCNLASGGSCRNWGLPCLALALGRAVAPPVRLGR
ncbi:prepilin-type N-terminal cleavage/methylation domain-containing protein [Pseudomonas spirodelae]|uniref:Prepilin-type N-terminal cleavage/methylation domain-containing protein n=1 Tax=Pseudomonas spirodelae TaxID=3101751 RepID=A0ABU5PB70_9PSED|nr:prepilin-type N-terminal cleavage/methylation domain-containing protein [Pseudomonas sp. T5W1]MEA1606758.1 prepilin-type N-terminal cleavage/methylation domain-containing protein [Pseudomonas sp. T5W1]